jgi:hypothetical protein
MELIDKPHLRLFSDLVVMCEGDHKLGDDSVLKNKHDNVHCTVCRDRNYIPLYCTYVETGIIFICIQTCIYLFCTK